MSVILKDRVYWIGYIDWNLRDFHSFEAKRGVTYNSYFIKDNDCALIDAVKGPFADDLLKKLAELSDFSKIKYVVCNHAELDHAGALPEVMKALPNAQLVCNKKCQGTLNLHFDTSNWNFKIVSTGDTISLGERTLRFIDTPMVHWPESMFTYLEEDKILFSMDAFGQHYTSSKHFDYEVPTALVIEEAKAYYANILMPFGKPIEKTLAQLENIEIEMIAPSHGIIWKESIEQIVSLYKDWSAYKAKSKVLVIYDTMWQSTASMARAILKGVEDSGVDVKLISIRNSNLTDIATEVLDSAGIAFGSSTINGEMMPMAGAVLTYLKGLKPKNKIAFAFGSYGWGRGGVDGIVEYFDKLKWEILREPIKSKYRPDEKILDECYNAGKMMAEKTKQVG
ncbi:MAG: FprA family A-type flavoprotein [candidate division Zixibacteria bacterium]|nr:FprA family A-type flavoprotein [candidate division Zixibacteria bacterium]